MLAHCVRPAGFPTTPQTHPAAGPFAFRISGCNVPSCMPNPECPISGVWYSVLQYALHLASAWIAWKAETS